MFFELASERFIEIIYCEITRNINISHYDVLLQHNGILPDILVIHSDVAIVMVAGKRPKLTNNPKIALAHRDEQDLGFIARMLCVGIIRDL